jgi:transcriptional regulator GlxA family with amidase domain
MAEAARISARQFARLFLTRRYTVAPSRKTPGSPGLEMLKETGDTPARAVERLRVEVALPRVQEGTEPIEMIARNVGLWDKSIWIARSGLAL